MLLFYCGFAVVISIPVLPLLYMKCILNAVFILINNKRQDYKGQNLLGLIITIILNPFILLVSLIIDLISLPNLLMKEERNFEFKYQ